MKFLLRLVFALSIILSPSISWSYAYGDSLDLSNQENAEFEVENWHYDDIRNIRYCCSDSHNSDLEEKIQSGSFFTFFRILDATKGGK